MSTQGEAILNSTPVMPVLVIKRVEDAVPLAKALKAGGLNVLEVTLRTDAALEAIKAIVAEVDDVVVGAGTVATVADLAAVEAAGATFAISPGATAALLAAGVKSSIPYIPAIATVSELMNGLDAGYNAFKFFPAEASGGVAALKAIAGPFPDARFCPTGGVSPDNFLDYLKLPNVCCVGGSWIVPTGLIEQQDWAGITALAADAVEQAVKRAGGA